LPAPPLFFLYNKLKGLREESRQAFIQGYLMGAHDDFLGKQGLPGDAEEAYQRWLRDKEE
jgi:hypothetical protein